MATLQPYFVQTPTNPTTDTFGAFIIGLQHGGWGNELEVDCYLDGVLGIETFPKGSVDFTIQFDNTPVGNHEAQFNFHTEGSSSTLATLNYQWEVVA